MRHREFDRYYYTFCIKQGSFQLYVQVFELDGLTTPYDRVRVDDIYVDRSLSPSSSFAGEQWYSGDHGSRIRLSFRVQCSANFYDSNCAIYCVAQDDSSGGHYTCGSSGEKICRSGWSDPNGNCLSRKELSSYSCLPTAHKGVPV